MASVLAVARWVLAVPFAVIGLSGMPDDLAHWAKWLESAQPYVNNGWVRLAAIALGLTFIFWPQLRQRLGIKRPVVTPTSELPPPAGWVSIRDAVTELVNALQQRVGEGLAIDQAAGAIVARASDGEFSLRGRRIGTSEREVIAKSYWYGAQIDVTDLKRSDSRSSKTAPNPNIPNNWVYTDLCMSRADMEKVWMPWQTR